MSSADELAKKKARLAELRRAKEARLLAASASPAKAQASVEQILASVGVVPPAPPVLTDTSLVDASLASPLRSAPATPISPARPAATSRVGKLSISDHVVVDIPGRSAVEVYEKVTQTDAVPEDERPSDGDVGVVEQSSIVQQMHGVVYDDNSAAESPSNVDPTTTEQVPNPVTSSFRSHTRTRRLQHIHRYIDTQIHRYIDT